MFGRKQKPSKNPRRGSANTDRAVFSYYQNRVIPGDDSVKASEERKQKQELSFRRHHILTFLTLLVITASFIYILSLSTSPKVIIVNQQDQATQSLLRSADTYQQATQKILEGSIFNRSKVSINTTSVAHSLQEQFPEISEATVSLPLINRRPIVYIQITQPVFFLNKGNEIFAIDQQGRVIMKGDANLPKSNLIHIEDQTSQAVEVSKPFLPARQVKFMQDIAAQLKNKGITDISFVLPPLPDVVYVKIKDRPYLVKMTFQNDPRLQAGTFLAVKDKLEADKITPAEYIDVRVDERAYYK